MLAHRKIPLLKSKVGKQINARNILVRGTKMAMT
jgi:hypothetical protein